MIVGDARAGRSRVHIHCRLTGCARGLHVEPPSHSSQSEHGRPAEGSRPDGQQFFYDGASMRQPVPGTVAIGGLKEDTASSRARARTGSSSRRFPTVDEACSSAAASAMGSIASRATTLVATARDPVPARQRPHRHSPGEDPVYPDGQIFDVITNGQGLMAAVSLADPSCGQVGDRRLRARTPARAAGAQCQRGRAHEPPLPASADATAGKPAGKR